MRSPSMDRGVAHDRYFFECSLGRTRHASGTHGSQNATKQEMRLYKSEMTWREVLPGLDMQGHVDCDAGLT